MKIRLIPVIIITCVAVLTNIAFSQEGFEKASGFKLSVTNPDAINNPAGAFFPGFRAGNQLVQYTPDYGKYTGTNEYGAEATIVNGIVVAKNGSNSAIPFNGYVLSGHGTAKKWLNEFTIIGTKVEIYTGKNEVKAITTPESHIFGAKFMLDEAENKLNKDISNKNNVAISSIKLLLSQAKQNLATAEANLDRKDYGQTVSESQKAYRLAEKAYFMAVPARTSEEHGVWVRPVEKNREQIEKTVSKLANAGFTQIYLETFYHGVTIYPSKVATAYGFTPQREEFKGFDALKNWIEIAHAHGLKVNAWVETFYVGTGGPGPILSKKPQWANMQRSAVGYDCEGLKPSTVEPSAYFLDPANPEARQYLVSLFSEMVRNYKLDGINLDYIRYPNSLPDYFPHYLQSTWGYSQLARAEFKRDFQIDPLGLSPSDQQWNDWTEYRQQKVSTLVKDVKHAIKKIKPGVKLSAVIFPDSTEAKIQKLQNWKNWANNRYVDILTPIILGSSPDYVKQASQSVSNSVQGKVKVYIGVFGAFNNDLPVIFIKQIEAAREGGAEGINVFDAAHLSEKYVNALVEGPFKKPARATKK